MLLSPASYGRVAPKFPPGGWPAFRVQSLRLPVTNPRAYPVTSIGFLLTSRKQYGGRVKVLTTRECLLSVSYKEYAPLGGMGCILDA